MIHSLTTGSWIPAQTATMDIVGQDNANTFQVWDDNNLTTPKFIVKRAGNVGIGTTNPVIKFQVNGPVYSNEPTTDTVYSAGFTGANFIGTGGNWGLRTAIDGGYRLDVFNSGSPINAMTVHINGNVGIGTTTPYYPLTVLTNTSQANGSISIWASGNISATGFITRTDVYDKSKGNALDYIKDAGELKYINGTINHKSFGYSYVSYNNQKQNGTRNESYIVNEIIRTENETLFDVIQNRTIEREVNIYGNVTKINVIPTYQIYKEEGIDLGKEVSMLKQAVFELNEKVKAQQIEIDKLKEGNI